ncbi:MAG: D-alanine--D-alanine ligase family protein [Planctomycetota bacterium]
MATVNSRLKTAVLMGGIGEERDISIQSGKCVQQALEQAGLNVVAADIAPDNLDILEDTSIDVFFVALHGTFGEDGRLQQILEDKSLVYTGSGPDASRLAFDKLAAKQRFTEAGVTTPRTIKFDAREEAGDLEKQIIRMSDRFVIKPLRQGSTIGVSIVNDPGSAVAAAQRCHGEFGDCMIEEFIPGREITVGILKGRALPIIEIRSKTGFYDYQAKYHDERTEYLFDTIDNPQLVQGIQAAAIRCFEALGCRHFARVDFILGNDGVAYALEVNTIPGMTAHSLLPKAASRAGISMSDLCVTIVEMALENEKLKTTS